MPVYEGEANKRASNGCIHVAFLHYLLHEGKSAKGGEKKNPKTTTKLTAERAPLILVPLTSLQNHEPLN